MTLRLSRRRVLIGTLAGGGLIAAWLLRPRDFGATMIAGDGEAAFGAWLTIGGDGVVTVAVPQLEMGQGVTTVIPQIVALELGADWRQIAVEPVPPSGAYANLPLAAQWAPLWMPALAGLADAPDDILTRRFAEHARFDATAAGTTLAAYEGPARAAAAAARAVLIAEAAERWAVAPEECTAADGLVTHGEKMLRFGPLAQGAARQAPPETIVLRPDPPMEAPGEEDVLPGVEALDGAAENAGEGDIAFPRLDLPAKVDGSWPFAGDIRLPGMVHAAIRHGPIGDARLIGISAQALADVPGIAGVVRARGWVAVAARSWWEAERALDRLAPHFRMGARVDSAAMAEALDQALRQGPFHTVAQTGARTDSGPDAFAKPDIARRYDIAPALHAPLETASATAWLGDGTLRLWVATQAPEQTRAAAAAAAGVALDDTILHPVAAGGSFDARLDHAHAIEAAVLTRELGRPVQLTWSRWQELLASPPRPPVAATLAARLGPDGSIAGLRARLAMPSTMQELGRRLFGNATARGAIAASAGEADALACAGLLAPYAIPDAGVQHAPVRLDLPTARMRGGADGYTAFMRESFVDEVAARAGRDPLTFRIAMLGGDTRLAECVQAAARRAGWGLEDGQGLACHAMPDPAGDPAGGGRIACVATARRGPGGIRVGRLTATVDLGRIVNRDIARQQIEGGLIFGLSLALGGAVDYADGLPVPARLADLRLPRLADTPAIAVDFVASAAPPFDPGEIAVAVIGPAIANAFAAATGLRLRRLPLLSGGI